MNKYLAPTIILVVIVATMTSFFIYESKASGIFPQFYLKKVAGNEKEVEHLFLQGTYTDNDSESLRISQSDSTHYDRERSILEQLIGKSEPAIERLQKKYRNFMRGKDEDMNQFWEDKERLIYATIVDTRDAGFSYKRMGGKVEIATLNKKKKEKSSFELDIPDIRKYSWMHVEKLRYANGKLFIITQNDRYTEKEEDLAEQHVYTVDLEKQKMVNDEPVLKAKHEVNDSNPDSMTEVTTNVVPQEPGEQENTIVFSETTSNFLFEKEKYEYLDAALAVHNLNTGKTKRLALPKEIKKDANPIYRNGTTVYFTKEQKDSIQLFAYDMTTGKTRKRQEFPLEKESDSPIIEMKHNKVYMVSPLMNQDTNATILVVDAETGKTLYKGVIKIKGKKVLTDNQELRIDYMEWE